MNSADLLSLAYVELREIARQRMAREAPGQTLQATALVHEAYLRLASDSSGSPGIGSSGPGSAGGDLWENRAHFFAAAAQAMRRILIEKFREKQSLKRGGAGRRTLLRESAVLSADDDVDYPALEAALDKLKQIDARKCEVVHLRYFAGLSIEETARVLEISPATVKTDWHFARAWLHREIQNG